MLLNLHRPKSINPTPGNILSISDFCYLLLPGSGRQQVADLTLHCSESSVKVDNLLTRDHPGCTGILCHVPLS